MNWRYRFVFGLLAFAFFGVVIRLFYWQVIKAQTLSEIARSQYSGVIKILPRRGEIRTSDKVPVASNKISYLVFANPREIKDKDKMVSFLSPILGSDPASISAQLSLDRLWVPIKSNVVADIKDSLDDLNLPGVGFEQQYARFYPEASMAAQMLGFVGKDEVGQPKGYLELKVTMIVCCEAKRVIQLKFMMP